MRRTITLTALICVMSCLAWNAGLATDDGRPVGQSLGTATPASLGRASLGTGSLTTTFASNNGFAGNTFDIVPAAGLTIQGFDFNIDPAGLSVAVDVYYKMGTCVGFETNQAAWTLLATGTGVAAGKDLPTHMRMPGAAGVTFRAGQTYGIYVDFLTYPSGRLHYTNGAPTTYSNADLTLTSNSGQSDGFKYVFHDRIWNGTIYYDNGAPPVPSVDLKCNGGDSNVFVPMGRNARIDASIDAGAGHGRRVDIWFGADSPFGWFSHDGRIWRFGGGYMHYTGPLMTTSAVLLDKPVPRGAWIVYGAIDHNANGVLNIGSIVAYDIVDFTVR